MCPATLDMLTMVPPPASRMAGATTCMQAMVPKKLISSNSRQADASMAVTESRMPTPALLTHTSTRSKWCSVNASARSISSRLRTSQARASVRSVCPTRWRAASARLASRESNTTLAPSSAKTLAIASPIPMEAPVTTTTFPAISMATLVSCGGRQVNAGKFSVSSSQWEPDGIGFF